MRASNGASSAKEAGVGSAAEGSSGISRLRRTFAAALPVQVTFLPQPTPIYQPAVAVMPTVPLPIAQGIEACHPRLANCDLLR